MDTIKTEHDLYVHISTEMMKVYLGDFLKNPGRGPLEPFLVSAMKDVDTIARRYVKVMSREFKSDAGNPETKATIAVPSVAQFNLNLDPDAKIGGDNA